MNRLSKEQSLYLRHAAHQKIDWYPWSEEAFEAARRQNKPVFLSSGAVWCHWCHVMARESFEDDETARLLNELFINIKLDRDERPDVDRRFQQAVAAMGSGSGWPLTVFLTHDKKPFFGGTYFPPRDHQGRPGFRGVLRAVSTFYQTKKGEAETYAASVLNALLPEEEVAEELHPGLLDKAEQDMLSLFDHRNGGFGTFPKFPMPGALEFLLRRHAAGDREAGAAVRTALLAMARGGFYDQIGGGFHRYSVDEGWIIPHFEKMADDNAALLRNYVDAYGVFGDAAFLGAARGILEFTGRDLADPAGGFYASQDADVTPDDEGGYFTWTDRQLRDSLNDDEYQLLFRHLVHPRGQMHHDQSKFVMAVHREPGEIAQEQGLSPEETARVIRQAKTKLLSVRHRRTAPLVDRTLYTSLNGMVIAAYFRAFMAFGDPGIRSAAVKSLDRIMQDRVRGTDVLHTGNVPGLLEDYVSLIDALVAGYEATAGRIYLDRAEDLMARCREKFLDPGHGGFFDTEEVLLGTRLKRIEDVPHPSANAAVIVVLLKLALLTDNPEYGAEAERSLRIFIGPARAMGPHAGAFFSALSLYFRQATMTIEAECDSGLARAARAEAVRSFSVVKYGENHGRVIPCLNGVCSVPVSGTGLFTHRSAK